MMTRVESPHGEVRFGLARRWLLLRAPAEPLLVVAHTLDAATALVRAVSREKGAVFGWSVESLASLAVRLSALPLAEQRLTLAPRLALEAVCVRVVSELDRAGKLGRLARIADRPGLPGALLRTFSELGMAEVDAERLPPELATAYRHYRATLASLQLADRSQMFQRAIAAARGQGCSAWRALCLYDVAIKTKLESVLLRTLSELSGPVFITQPAHDTWTSGARAAFASPLGGHELEALSRALLSAPPGLRSLQVQLFSSADTVGEPDESVSILSAPGESRECVEIARRVLAEAERGVPFDQMAILLRSPYHYRTHLVEALRRASIPAYFSKGTRKPEPSGRALLVLLDCVAEGISATRFAEYLSLGVLPAFASPGRDASDSIAHADEETSFLLRAGREGEATRDEAYDPSLEPHFAQLSMPRRWEALLVDAAVVGGAERWRKRLAGLEQTLERRSQDAGPSQIEDTRRELDSLRELSAFCLPLVDALAALPECAPWGEWLDALMPLVERAVRNPEPALAALSELQILRAVGPVSLAEVRAVLKNRLGDVILPPGPARGGEILVLSVDEARGRVFDTVFIPGLAEKLFPQRVVEDPLLPDIQRAAVSGELEDQSRRVASERMALSIAVGCARSRVILSYPRFENDKARPRVASFYALEAIRAAEGRLPGFAELALRADAASRTRMGWPAPEQASDAIDASEYDLAVLHRFLATEKPEFDGAARYLLASNARLARALQFRARRWRKEWRNVDGLVDPPAPARAALASRREALTERGFAVTALERYSVCPYRFYLSTVLGLRSRETTPHVEELDAATRGSLIHAILHAAGVELLERGLLHGAADEREAERVLDQVVAGVAESFRQALAPAIDRVWQDAVDEIRVDLNRWFHELSRGEWQPLHFELGFGFERASATTEDSARSAGDLRPVRLAFGLPLRGSIDLVEQRDGSLRATDYKTGIAPAPGSVVLGGIALQPTFYALVLEQLFPGKSVAGGNAFYCSSRGEFRRNEVALNERNRDAAAKVHAAIAHAFDTGFFPAAPSKDACDHCEFKIICGPHEPERVARKERARLEPLLELRRMP